jgi:hypothetical protein
MCRLVGALRRDLKCITETFAQTHSASGDYQLVTLSSNNSV